MRIEESNRGNLNQKNTKAVDQKMVNEPAGHFDRPKNTPELLKGRLINYSSVSH